MSYNSGSTAWSHYYPENAISEDFLSEYSHVIMSFEITATGDGFEPHGGCLIEIWDGDGWPNDWVYTNRGYIYKKTGSKLVTSTKLKTTDIGTYIGIITHRCNAKIYGVWLGKRLD